MKQFIVFGILTLIVWTCGGSGSEQSQSASSTTVAAKEAPDGKKIFKQYCVACHGLYGDMGASGAFNLQEATLTLEERITVIKKGRGAMTPFENLLSEEEIAAVAEYTFELKQ